MIVRRTYGGWTAALLWTTAVLCALPGVPALAQDYEDDLPALPSEMRPCQPRDMHGLRKLTRVLESPVGEATMSFNGAPHQYLFFRPNQTFVSLAGSIRYPGPRAINPALREKYKEDIRQYVLGESGALYFYKDGKATDAFTCRIVVEPEPPFGRNAMILIMNDTESHHITLRVYARHNFGKVVKGQGKPRAKPRPQINPEKKKAQQRIIQLRRQQTGIQQNGFQ